MGIRVQQPKLRDGRKETESPRPHSDTSQAEKTSLKKKLEAGEQRRVKKGDQTGKKRKRE